MHSRFACRWIHVRNERQGRWGFWRFGAGCRHFITWFRCTNNFTMDFESTYKLSEAKVTTPVIFALWAATSPPTKRRNPSIEWQSNDESKPYSREWLLTDRPGWCSSLSRAAFSETQTLKSCEAVTSRPTCRPIRSKRKFITLLSKSRTILATVLPISSTSQLNCSASLLTAGSNTVNDLTLNSPPSVPPLQQDVPLLPRKAECP